MNIIVHARQTDLTGGPRDLARQPARHALDRSAQDIARAVVTVEGGRSPSCRVSVRGRSLGQVLIRDEDASVAAAIGRATSRAGRAVARRLERQRRDRGDRAGWLRHARAPLAGYVTG